MPALPVTLPAVLLAQGGGHGHVLDVGVSIGPTVLRIGLLVAVPAVAGFALLRGFLPDPDVRTLTAVIGTAAGAAVLVLLLSGGLNFSERLVPLLLALLALPIYLVRSRDPRFARAVGLARRLAPWVFWTGTALAALLFAQARLSGAGPERTATLLHTGVVLALVALAWFAVVRQRPTAGSVGVRCAAGLLAVALLVASAEATVLRPDESGAASVVPADVSARK